MKEEKIKLEAECERLHNTLDANVQALKDAEKEARVLESTNNKLNNTLALAERDNESLLVQMKERESSMMKTQKNLEDLASKTNVMKDKNRQLDNECGRLEGECEQATAHLTAEVAKNRELAGKLKSLDTNIRVTEAELEEATTKK